MSEDKKKADETIDHMLENQEEWFKDEYPIEYEQLTTKQLSPEKAKSEDLMKMPKEQLMEFKLYDFRKLISKQEVAEGCAQAIID